MNIALFFTFDYSLDTWYETGTLNREVKLFNDLYRDGISTTYFTWGNFIDEKYYGDIITPKIVPLYEKIKFRKNKLLRFINSFFVVFRIKKEIENIDIIYQNQLQGSWIPILLKIVYKKKLIIRTGYDMLSFAKFENKSKLKILLYEILTFITLFFSDTYTVTSKEDYIFLSNKYKKLKHKLSVIPNWVEANKKDVIKKSNSKILSVGRLVKQKNFDHLFREMSGIKNDFELDIIGKGPDEKFLKDLAKELNLKVNFLGSFNHQELMKKFHEYNFFVTTAIFEGNPKTVLEAMASGCVVFASDIPNHRSIINSNFNGVLFSFRKNDLKNNLLKTANNSSNMKQISLNAIKSMKSNNSFEHIRKLTLDVLYDL